MITAKLLIAACLAVAAPMSGDDAAVDDGTIAGVVVNASQDKTPVAGAEIYLRMKIDNEFVPLAKTTSDQQGRYVFADVPVGPQFQYMPGANYQGIHYPGPQLKLLPGHNNAAVDLSVHDVVTEPSPLVIRRQDVVIRPENGALRVRESILIDNPSDKTYVGKSAHEGMDPVTLCLNIPPDFDRTTFDKEFYGRQFTLIEGKVVTSIPWTPGQRELNFTYVLPNTQSHRVWQRPLDLPCERLSVRVETDKPDEVACNLASQPPSSGAGRNELAFASKAALPAGHVVSLELGHLPVPWMAWARWFAVVTLIHLIVGGAVMALRRRSRVKRQAAPPSKVPAPASSVTAAASLSGPHFRETGKKRKKKHSARRSGKA